MTFENSWVLHLNSWGLKHHGLIDFTASTLVYVVLLLAALWILRDALMISPLKSGFTAFLRTLVKDGIINFVIPLGGAIVLSEILSKIINRDRPFVAVPGVHLVIAHSADGGMPSHHVLFMVAVATAIYLRSKAAGTVLIALALISGIARVAAGIHYPSDIVVGAIIGWALVVVYRRFLPAQFRSLA
jgi:membrane-associated phospholipid phosphatase